MRPKFIRGGTSTVEVMTAFNTFLSEQDLLRWISETVWYPCDSSVAVDDEKASRPVVLASLSAGPVQFFESIMFDSSGLLGEESSYREHHKKFTRKQKTMPEMACLTVVP